MGRETDANGLYWAIGWKDADFAELTKEISSSIADYQKAAKQHRDCDQFFIFSPYIYAPNWCIELAEQLWPKNLHQYDDLPTRHDAATTRGIVEFMAIPFGSFDS